MGGKSGCITEDAVKDRSAFGSLDRKACCRVTQVRYLHFIGFREQVLKLCPVFADFAGIDDQEELHRAAAVKDEIVDHTTPFIQQDRVLSLPDFELRYIIGQSTIQKSQCTTAADGELPHVRDVKHTHSIPHGLMFLNDACVLHRHLPTSKRDDFAAYRDMAFI
jgi:hypothetical protein